MAFSEVEEGGVGSTRDVVDDMGSRLEGSLGDIRFSGVYGDDALVRGQSFDHGQDAAKFLVNGYRITARAGTLTADVDELGTFLQHLADSIDCLGNL